MSEVTNLILTFSTSESINDRIKDVNSFEYRGSFNYLPLEQFIDYLRKVGWEEPGNVQVIVKEQSDEKFRIIEL